MSERANWLAAAAHLGTMPESLDEKLNLARRAHVIELLFERFTLDELDGLATGKLKLVPSVGRAATG